VIVVTGQGEKAVALQAIGAGAYDFLIKPLDMDELSAILKRCLYVGRLEEEYREMQQRMQTDPLEGLTGSDASMQAVIASVRKVAATEASVLILGESGTGKEMTARAIHQLSPRRKGPFVAINCGAIPENLMESELFGHEKGAFSGAHLQRKGRVESANGGTLFLDEIGEISPALQVKLLRFLQERVIERVGGRQEIVVDTRVLAATNVDINRRMADGAFREDLYYRLAVVQILLPALRNRNGDIELLARSFLQRYAAEAGKKGLFFAAEALKSIQLHPWPGNIREMQNRIRRAVIMSAGKKVTVEDLDLVAVESSSAASSLREAREKLEREMIVDALRKHAGVITAAAHDLGVSRPTFYELMDKLKIERPLVRRP
jgi:two-component system NtrC family response regulator